MELLHRSFSISIPNNTKNVLPLIDWLQEIYKTKNFKDHNFKKFARIRFNNSQYKARDSITQ